MHTNKELLAKGIKRLGFTVLLMFLAPFTIYEAFKNETHPWYLPVLIIGLVFAISAIAMAFYSIKTIMDSLFNKE
jgi:hypothetical protein